jgi:hypothetical protein
MNNCSLEYIASGMSYSRIVFKEAHEEEEVCNYINHCFSAMQNVGNHHKFSILANAWTEEKFGEIFQAYRKSVNEIMLDSGGLQIITQGKKCTEEMRQKVYQIQGKWADTGMSFDEIPLEVTGEASSRNDLSNRRFDDSIFEECAIQSGKNLKNQIQAFLDMESSCLPIFIAQGNCYETYMKWADIALKQLPSSYRDHIGGVAMGGAALGLGQLEDIKRAFFFSKLPIKTNRLHVLGVGSVSRMVPYIIMAQSGLYKDVHISYDSTTHTSGIEMGRFYGKNRTLRFSRTMAPIYQYMFECMQSSPFRIEGLTLDLMFESLNCPSLVFKEKHGSRNLFIQICVGMICTSIRNFVMHVETILGSKSAVLSSFKKSKDKNNMGLLYGIKTLEDFQYWETQIGNRFVTSKSVSKNIKTQVQLDELF